MKLTLPDRDLQIWIVFNAILSVIAIIIFTVVLPNYGRIMQALTPRPERFTELYFEDHLDLPATIIPGSPFSIAFTVNNKEHDFVDYRAEVTAQSESSVSAQVDIPLYETRFKLLNNESMLVPLELELPKDFPIGRAKITVRLVEQNQNIYFWARTASASAGVNPLIASPSAILVPEPPPFVNVLEQ